jgi:hypothetical protein
MGYYHKRSFNLDRPGQPPSGFGLRQARSKGRRQAWGATRPASQTQHCRSDNSLAWPSPALSVLAKKSAFPYRFCFFGIVAGALFAPRHHLSYRDIHNGSRPASITNLQQSNPGNSGRPKSGHCHRSRSASRKRHREYGHPSSATRAAAVALERGWRADGHRCIDTMGGQEQSQPHKYNKLCHRRKGSKYAGMSRCEVSKYG